jgi:asparagine synthase (glutamine-hydrolysing)
MYPFISLLWDPANPGTATVARQLLMKISKYLPDYEFALQEKGCVVCHRPPPGGAMRAYLLPQHAGILLGRVFPMSPDEWSIGWSWSPSPAEATEIIRTRGEWLIQEMWGAYVAFLLDDANQSAWVIRDCSGGLPCYHVKHAAVDLFFGDPATLCILGLVPASLNFDYICAYLRWSQLQIRDTALEGVTELLAGDCFQRNSAESYVQYSVWSPASVLNRRHVTHFRSAVHDVRRTTTDCINAWASVFDSIMLSLSGGLDSSVVLGCLAQCRMASTLICANQVGVKGSNEDERAFARLAASQANVTLLELPMFADSQRMDDSLTQQPLSAKPTQSSALGPAGASLLDDIAERNKVNCIWSGQGGDHLFMQMPLPLGPIDYTALRGFGLGLPRCIRDAVHISKWNYWRVARLLWSKDFDFAAPVLGEATPAEDPFITAEAARRVSPEKLVHPWVLSAKSLSLGQRVQVAALSQVVNRHRPLPGSEHTVLHHPLLSQPLLELCLRIPSYLHLHGGIDRAVERAAFADIVPKEIAARRQKGACTVSVLEIVHRSREYLCDLLLDGVLVKSGILSRDSIEPYITGRRPTDARTIWPLLSSIAAEIWIRNWRNCLDKTLRSNHDRPVEVR